MTQGFRIWLGLAGAAVGVLTTASAFSISLEHKRFNIQIGPEFVAEPYKGGDKDGILHLSPDYNNPSQLITPKQVNGELYQFTANGGTTCIDVVNGGPFNNYVRMAPCGNYSGQLWTMRRKTDKQHSFTNEFNGPQMCLDVVLGGRDDGDLVMMPCDGRTSQLWGSTENK